MSTPVFMYGDPPRCGHETIRSHLEQNSKIGENFRLLSIETSEDCSLIEKM